MSVQHEHRQHNVRASRPLADRITPQAGPLTISVVEPFRRLRVTLEQDDHPLSAELGWTSTFPATLETPHVQFAGGRTIQDISRYGQVGRWSGWIRLDGQVHASDSWWGVRDHSWGVRRDIGGFESPYGHKREAILWLWSYAATDELSCYFQLTEDGAGRRRELEGRVRRPLDSGGEPIGVASVSHDISFLPGTRVWKELTYHVVLDNGEQLTIEAGPVQTAWAYRGTGYENGFNDARGAGVDRGAITETDVLDVSDPGRVRLGGEDYFPGHREQPARVTVNGRPGFGHLPVMSSGRIERYGLGRRP